MLNNLSVRNATNKSEKAFFSFMKFILTIACLNVKILSLSVSPLSFYDYAPLLVEAERRNFMKGTAIDNDATNIFNSTYTVTLLRLKNQTSSSYFVTIGFKHMMIDISTYPFATLAYSIMIQNVTGSSFGCLAYASYELYFTKYQMSYIAISKEVGNLYYFNQLFFVNQALVYPTYADFTFTDSSIKQIGQNYIMVHSIYKLVMGNTALSISNAIVTYLIANSTTLYTLRLYTYNLFVHSFGVQGILFDPSMVNNFQKKHIFITHKYAHGAPSTNFQGPIYDFPGIMVTSQNGFIGFYTYHSAGNKIDFQIYFTNNQVRMAKPATTYTIYVQIIVFLRNLCPNPFTYDETEGACFPCMNNCLRCDAGQCFECDVNFTLSVDETQCLCDKQLVSGICFDFDQSDIKGCTNAFFGPSGIECIMCSITQNLILINNTCKCIEGYEFDSNKDCVQTCGDGKIYEFECDDGNTLDGDGCNNLCIPEIGFQCDDGQPTFCKLNQELKFKLLSVMKNKDNSALFKFGTGKKLRFDLSSDQFTGMNGSKKLNLSIFKNGNKINLQSSLVSVQDNQISILVNYDFTIECFEGELLLDLSLTKYTPSSGSVQFNACGTNEPLIVSDHLTMFNTTSFIYQAFGILILILLLIGLCAPKFIGLQAILTLQLIYYSCLLIIDVKKIPVGFSTFKSFKYSTGFNDFFKITSIALSGQLQKKIVWMTLQKTVIENYNLSFVFLLASAILMAISSFYRQSRQNDFQGRSHQYSKLQLQKMHCNLDFAQKMNTRFYNFLTQISAWSILQFFSAGSIQLMVRNQSISLSANGDLIKYGSLILVLAGMVILFMGLNSFNNVFLSQTAWGKISAQIHMLRYKHINFLYLVTMSVIIMLLNQVVLFKVIPMSIIALCVHTAYTICIIVINPYRNSLKVHKWGLLLCQLTYFVFLMAINVVNLVQKFDEIYSLVFVYFILFVCVIIVVFTIIRLYYEYRYGEELQKKIQRDNEIQRNVRISKQQAQFRKKMRKIQTKISEKLNKRQQLRIMNPFLMQNQIKEDLMNDEIQFLNNRPKISQEKKQTYYFQKFESKPLNWLKLNNVQEYYKKVSQIQEKNEIENNKKKQRQLDPDYLQITNKLKKQFYRMNKPLKLYSDAQQAL